MRDENEDIQMIDPQNGHSGHPMAVGLITGAAVGIGLGMLFAPRKGSELRHQVADQAKHVASTASTGYHRAKDTAGRYAHRGHDAYCICRDKVAKGAHEVGRYVREVADAATLKSRKVSDAARVTAPAQVTTSPKASAAAHPQADQPGRAREHASQPPEAKKDLRAV
jgi:gas vesicle protein